MMMDIFSTFDPTTSTYFNIMGSTFWLLNFVFMLSIPTIFWVSPSRMTSLMYKCNEAPNAQANQTTLTNIKGMITMLVPVFMLILFINFMGMIPYSFGNSSQVLFTFSLGIPLWLALIMSSMKLSMTTFLAKLLPTGTPLMLSPIMVIIEMISILFRPLTLCFRLAANMTAGHVVM